MSSATRSLTLAICLAANASMLALTSLRVCADPHDLPYSNQDQQGFENHIASLIGSDLGRPVEYLWFPQREAFLRKTLNSGVCDVVMAVPIGIDQAETTTPYYRSTYVFITRRDRHLRIHSFDDPRLRTLKIGVHILGEQSDSLPPVYALTSRGLAGNLVGYSIFGDRLDEQDPAANLVHAVEDKKVDIAVAWGPMAGYFAKHSSVPLELTPVEDDPSNPALALHFDIAMGVRPGDDALRDALNTELHRRHEEIEQILRTYGVPQLTSAPDSATHAEKE